MTGDRPASAWPRARHTSRHTSKADSAQGVADELAAIFFHLAIGQGATLWAHQLGLCGHGVRVNIHPGGSVDAWLPPALLLGDEADGGWDDCGGGLGWLVESGWRPFPSTHQGGGLCDAMRPWAAQRCVWCDPPTPTDLEWCCCPLLGRPWPPTAPLTRIAVDVVAALGVVVGRPALWCHYEARWWHGSILGAYVDLADARYTTGPPQAAAAPRPPSPSGWDDDEDEVWAW